MFRKILIANRGEIACRVIATARRLGIASVAVYSDADRDALHVTLADEAVHIGPAPATESYLQIPRVLEAALRSGADGVHPGYGFLSENAGFARACAGQGLVFIGPPPEAIEAMGSKSRAKQIMERADVPLIPGYHGDEQDAQTLLAAARAMGYPVLLKATAGGGGKGMRAVEEDEAFEQALAAARREAMASFGDDRMLVEKLLQRPRHVEVQVFCDRSGNALYLAERDCSIQRRHQKVIEEAPAPGLTESLREQMGQAAVDAARAIDYQGAGTVEFLLDASGSFYFMEMNTRLQVEHPVTEMITGLDLVEWQLRVAAGELLPLAQDQVTVQGHALEARIYAEDVTRDFLPSTGVIDHLALPDGAPWLRVDTGVEAGSEISPYYDPLIAKLIVHGRDRGEAIRRMQGALRAFRVTGLATNLGFLYNLVSAAPFAEQDLDTEFIARHSERLFGNPPARLARDLAASALALLSIRAGAHRGSHQGDPWSPWTGAGGWKLNQAHSQRMRLHCHGSTHDIHLLIQGGEYRLQAAHQSLSFRGGVKGDRVTLEIEGHSVSAWLSRSGGLFTLFWDDGACQLREVEADIGEAGVAAGDSEFAAPMHGTIVALLCEPGSTVEAGDGVLVMEAMKMEQTLRAPCAGTLLDYPCAVGDLVDRGQVLANFEAAP